MCSQQRLVGNKIQQWLSTTGMLGFPNRRTKNWWQEDGDERKEEKSKRLRLSVSHFFSVGGDIQPLNQVIILAPVPWFWLSSSRSIFKSLHPSWRSSSPSQAVTDGGTERKNEQKERETLSIVREKKKYSSTNVCLNESIYKMWFRCNQFHLSQLEVVCSNILLCNDSFLPQECLWERLKATLHFRPDRHTLTAVLGTAWIYIYSNPMLSLLRIT